MLVTFFLGAFPRLSETFILNQITGLIDRGVDVRVVAILPTHEQAIHRDFNNYNLRARVKYAFPKQAPGRFTLLWQELYKSPSSVLKSIQPWKVGQWSYSPKFLTNSRVFAEIENNRSSDVVLAHFGGIGDMACCIRETGSFKAPLGVFFHGSDMAHPLARGGKLYPRLKKWGDLYLPISERWKNALITEGFDEQKIKVHRVGVSVPQHVPNLDRTGFTDAVKLLSVSRFVEKKGLEFAIRAVGHLKAAGRNVKYTIAGDGELRENLQKLTQELKLQYVINFVGQLRSDEVTQIMRSHDIFLCPSVTASSGDQEGIPTAIMESMSNGLLVVSTNHSGIPELVRHDENGLLTRERDSQGLAKEIEKLIDRPELHQMFRKNGHAWVDQHFNINRLNDLLTERIKQLAAGYPVL